MRALVRDAWQPRRVPTDNRHRMRLGPGDRRPAAHPAAPDRRGDLRAVGVTVRSPGPLGLVARQQTRDVPGSVRSLPPFESRKHLPSRLARLRELDGRAAVRVRGQGTEFDSLREYVRGDDVRSIDWRASARNRNVVVRTWQPERDRRVVLRARHLPDLGRAGRRRARASTRPWTPPCCWPRSPPAPATGSTSWPATAGSGPAALARRARRRRDAPGRDGRSRAGHRRGRLGRPGRRGPGAGAAAGARRPAHAAGAVGRSRRVCCRAAHPDPAPPGGDRLGQGPRARADGPARGPPSPRSTTPPPPSRQLRRRARTADLLTRLGVDVIDADAERLPPALADHYLQLKAAGLL